MNLHENNKEQLRLELMKLKLQKIQSVQDKMRIQHIQQILDKE
jgi:hypothetical protein